MTYETALANGRKAGAGRCSDTEAMALFCDSALQILAGAVSPKLVWEGAQSKGLSFKELAHLAATGWKAVSELQWVT